MDDDCVASMAKHYSVTAKEIETKVKQVWKCVYLQAIGEY